MGKQTQQQQHQLATPPGSTRIEAQLSDFLPELSLPPLEVSLDHTARTKRHAEPRSAAVASRKRTLHTAEEEASDVSSDAHREAQRDTATSRKRIARPSRKTTHSQIEKRRREKINDTMARLKQLVPACHGDNAESLKKLDVLTETANYIDALHMQLRQYQAAAVGEAEASKERSLHSRCSSLSATSSVLAFDAFTQPALSYSPMTREKTDSPISDLSLGSQTSASRAAAAVYLDERARTAAESLVQISESPMLGPVKRMSIAELMHL